MGVLPSGSDHRSSSSKGAVSSWSLAKGAIQPQACKSQIQAKSCIPALYQHHAPDLEFSQGLRESTAVALLQEPGADVAGANESCEFDLSMIE